VGTLEITVDSGERGPVIRLNGEADLSTARELSGVLTAQISGGARHLTVELSQLRFADSATVRTLVEAYHMLGDRGGTLELAGPQPAVARTLSLLGMDQVLHVGPSVGTTREADRADRA
jgi:anti-sigma B factor antagonist